MISQASGGRRRGDLLLGEQAVLHREHRCGSPARGVYLGVDVLDVMAGRLRRDHQDRLNWLDRLVVCCDCNRPTLDSIQAAGFTLTLLERTALPKVPAFVRPAILGSATAPALVRPAPATP